MPKNSDLKLTYVYQCFDATQTLLYVGVTTHPDRRLKQHEGDKLWWGDVASTTRRGFETRLQALWAEWALIVTAQPLYNTAMKSPQTVQPCPCSEDQPRFAWDLDKLLAYGTNFASKTPAQLREPFLRMAEATGQPSPPEDIFSGINLAGLLLAVERGEAGPVKQKWNRRGLA